MDQTFIYTRPLFHNREKGLMFESDTYKAVRRHLQDQKHVITEEEIREIRIGIMPPLEELLPQLRNETGK